jgi:hypothetical protein
MKERKVSLLLDESAKVDSLVLQFEERYGDRLVAEGMLRDDQCPELHEEQARRILDELTAVLPAATLNAMVRQTVARVAPDFAAIMGDRDA